MLYGCPPSLDAWGRLNVVTPFHHLSGDSHINSSLREGPLRHLIKLSYPADRSTLSETKPYRRNAPIPRAFERASYFCAVRRSSASNRTGRRLAGTTPIGNRSCRASC